MSRVIDVRQEPGRVVVRLRRYAMWQALAFPGAHLVLLLGYAVSRPDSRPDRVAVLTVLGGGAVLGALAYWVAHLLAGREEVVTASGTQLVIDRQVLRRPELMFAGMVWMALRAEKRGWRVREERCVSRTTSGA